MSKYTFGKDLEDSFDYGVYLDGKLNEYTVKYPSQKELRPIQFGYARLQELDKEYGKLKDDDKKGKDIAAAFNGLFTPHDGAMPLEDMLDNLPANKKRLFDYMIQAELLDDEEAKAKLKALGM